METAMISATINKNDIPLLENILKLIKAKNIKVKSNDPTEMSKEDFFAMIDDARKSPSRKVSEEDIKNMFGL